MDKLLRHTTLIVFLAGGLLGFICGVSYEKSYNIQKTNDRLKEELLKQTLPLPPTKMNDEEMEGVDKIEEDTI